MEGAEFSGRGARETTVSAALSPRPPAAYLGSVPPDDAQHPLLVLTTAPDAEVARRIARELIERRLAACVQLTPGLTSLYRWEGALQQSAEIGLSIKTVRRHVPAIELAFATLHPYAVPEFVVVDALHVAAPYRAWLLSETAAP